MNKAFDDFLWEDYSSTKTPLAKRLLNKVNSALKTIDERVMRIFNDEIPNIKNTKLDTAEAYGFVEDVFLDKDGILTVTHYNGDKDSYKSLLGKLAINFDFDEETQKMIIYLSGGEQKEVDLSAFITEYEFLGSDTIYFSVSEGDVAFDAKWTSNSIGYGIFDNSTIQETYQSIIVQSELPISQISAKYTKPSEKDFLSAEINQGMTGDSRTYVINFPGGAKNWSISMQTEEDIGDGTKKAIGYYTKPGCVTAGIKEGSIQEKHLRPNYLSDILVESAKAESSADSAAQKALESADSALLSKSYSGGNTGVREGEGTDNAKYYSEQAKQALESLEQAGTVTGVKGNAEASYRTGNVDITPENIGTYTASYIDEHFIDSGDPIPSVGKTGYIAYPSDAYYQANQSNVSGYIKITLPVSWTNTFVRFTVSIFTMSENESCDYHISGYNYAATSTWTNCTAVCVGKAGSAHTNLNVRFGHNGTKCVIGIGEIGTRWDYPVIQIHDIELGYYKNDYETWESGWDVSIGTSLPATVNTTMQNTHVAYGGAAGSCAGNAATASKLANARKIFGIPFNGLDDVSGQALVHGAYQSAPNQRYNSGGLQVRENGLVGNSQTDIGYAPTIGFHWMNKAAGMLAMDSTGIFHLFRQDGVTPANLEAVVTKATQDGIGRIIAETYALKSIYGNNSISCGARENDFQSQSITFGYNGLAGNFASCAFGKYNKTMRGGGSATDQVGDAFVIGNGYYSGSSGTNYSNSLRVTYSGDVMGTKAFQSSGADYAEHTKEWADGNPDGEDRVGYMVTVKGGLLYKAQPGDYIAGITSGNPSVVGNADEDYYWKYERDEFNRIVMEDVPEMVQQTDEDGNLVFDEETHEPVMVETGNIIKNARMKLSKSYDPSLQESYIPRAERKEWDYVGMRGIIPVRDDGTCLQDHFCKCGQGGIATLAEERGFDTFYVIERISENVVGVEI